MFYQDSTLQALIADAEAEFANMEDINEQLKSAFSRLNSWIPELQQPCFYAQIGALDQSIVVGEHSVGISLDKYMGENYPLYKKFYTPQHLSDGSVRHPSAARPRSAHGQDYVGCKQGDGQGDFQDQVCEYNQRLCKAQP